MAPSHEPPSRQRRSRTVVVPPRPLTFTGRRDLLGGASPVLGILVVAAAFVGWILSRGETRRVRLAERYTLTATRGDLALRARAVAVPEGVLDGRECLGAGTRWAFPRATREALTGTLRDVVGDPAAVQSVLARARCDEEGCVIEPEGRLVESLAPAVRARLYDLLGRDGENAAQFAPFRRAASVVPFADTPGLPAEAREAVARLSWDDHGVRLFADLPAACAHVRSAEARRALVRAIQHPVTYEISLRTQSIAAARLVASFPLAARVDVRQTLDRARAEGRAEVPIEVFLPAGVRRANGAWPDPSDPRDRALGVALHADDEGAARALSSTEAETELAARFAPIGDERPHFGDVMVLLRSDNTIERAVVHLVAGMVFVAPERERMRPGHVAPLEDVLLDHPDLWRVETWRLRAGQRGR